MKRLFAALFVIVLVLASCGKKPDAVTTEQGMAEATGEAEYKLPEFDFEEHEFYILSVGRRTNTNDFLYNDEAPSVLDLAVERRNKAVEEQYNIRIATEQIDTTANYQSPEAYRELVREATAGDYSYDMCVIPGYDVCQLACQGYLTDLNTLPYFNAENEWYDQKANETFTFGDTLYYTTGDYGICLMNQTYCIAFNKDLAAQYAIENPYELVRERKWTLEKMHQIAKEVSDDTDGDGVTDVYGIYYWVDAAYGIVNAAGERSVVLDPNTLNMQLTLNTETTFNVLEYFANMVLDPEISLKYQHNSAAKEYIDVFSGNRALFFMTTIGKLGEFRDMETDYGILPYTLCGPNTEYSNTVAPFYMTCMCVPMLVEDEERTSAVIEAIGYYSNDYIIPAYYEKTLNGQYTRDEESGEMLDIIFDTRAYDLGYVFQPSQLPENMLFMIRDGVFDWSSRYARLEISAQTLLNYYSKFYRQTIGMEE
ncbi:MAG: extracellular solute-binding protein [Clostridia bacterium]|nr:extracellular solute-binding protein [Clostridia bacterium]